MQVKRPRWQFPLDRQPRVAFGEAASLGTWRKGIWGCRKGDVGMGMLNLAGQGWGWRDEDSELGRSRNGDVGMWSLGGAKWKNGDIEPGRTGPVLGYFPSPKEGISRCPE